jgi:hypothetical protein
MSKNVRMPRSKNKVLVYFYSEFMIQLFPQDKDGGVRSGADTHRKVAAGITDWVTEIFH